MDKTWIVSIGAEKGQVQAPDHWEAATRYIEKLTAITDKFGMGILIKVVELPEYKVHHVKSDIVLANAGLHSTAAAMQKFYNKK